MYGTASRTSMPSWQVGLLLFQDLMTKHMYTRITTNSHLPPITTDICGTTSFPCCISRKRRSLLPSGGSCPTTLVINGATYTVPTNRGCM